MVRLGAGSWTHLKTLRLQVVLPHALSLPSSWLTSPAARMLRDDTLLCARGFPGFALLCVSVRARSSSCVPLCLICGLVGSRATHVSLGD
eukprot:92885-Hanusia_phi.AAC.1